MCICANDDKIRQDRFMCEHTILFKMLFFRTVSLHLINDSSPKSGLVIQFNLLDDRVWQNVGTLSATHLNKPKFELVKCVCTLAAQPEMRCMYLSVRQ